MSGPSHDKPRIAPVAPQQVGVDLSKEGRLTAVGGGDDYAAQLNSDAQPDRLTKSNHGEKKLPPGGFNYNGDHS